MESTHLEVKRQLFHLGLGLIIVALIYYDLLNWVGLAIITLLAAVSSLIVENMNIGFFEFFRTHFSRPGEYLGRPPLMFFLGSFIVVVFFSKNIALAAITILAVGDSFSHLIGRFYGKVLTPLSEKKMLEGFLAGWILAAIVAAMFVGWIYAFIAAFVAMLVEFTDIPIQIDDNITVPLAAAITLWVITLIV